MSVSTGRTRAFSLPGGAGLSLRARLLALLCAAALLPMTVIGVLGSRTAAATLTEEREAELSEVASLYRRRGCDCTGIIRG